MYTDLSFYCRPVQHSCRDGLTGLWASPARGGAACSSCARPSPADNQSSWSFPLSNNRQHCSSDVFLHGWKGSRSDPSCQHSSTIVPVIRFLCFPIFPSHKIHPSIIYCSSPRDQWFLRPTINESSASLRIDKDTFLWFTCLETWTVSHRMHFLFLSISWKSAHHCKNNEIWATDRLGTTAGLAATAPWSICSWLSKHIYVQEQIQSDWNHETPSVNPCRYFPSLKSLLWTGWGHSFSKKVKI